MVNGVLFLDKDVAEIHENLIAPVFIHNLQVCRSIRQKYVHNPFTVVKVSMSTQLYTRFTFFQKRSSRISGLSVLYLFRPVCFQARCWLERTKGLCANRCKRSHFWCCHKNCVFTPSEKNNARRLPQKTEWHRNFARLSGSMTVWEG